MAGVETTGFNRKLLSDILAEIEADEKATISPNLNTLATSVLGQLNGIYADKLRELWEVLEAVYQSFYPDTASGQSLDAVAAITGALRLPATQSEVTVSVNIDAGVTIPAGSVLEIDATGERWETLAAVTNSGAVAADFDVACVSQNFGPIAGPADTIRKIVTPVTGWNEVAATILSGNAQTYNLSDGMTLTIKVDDGPEQTATFNTADFVDINNATAAEVAAVIDTDIVGVSTSTATKVRITSDEDGFTSALEVTGGTANTALGFSTARVVGSPYNALDATPGTNLETDAAFRQRREQLLRATGQGTLEAIIARVIEVEDVVQVFGFENTTLVTDSDGLPGKAFEIVVSGGADADIAEAIWNAKPAGILSFGTTTVQVTDSQGVDHDISFSRPTLLNMWCDYDVTANADEFPVDGEDQIKAAVVALGDLLQIGEDVSYAKFGCAPFDVTGVTDITLFELSDFTPPTGLVTFVVASRELAVFDTSRINVNVTLV